MTGTPPTDDDYPITHSPLERKVTRDGITVEICIYRGETDQGWILEIEDQNGGSTVWDDLATDQDALDLAMKTIEEEGIASFAESMKNGSGEPQPRQLPLTASELKELKRALGDRSLDAALGMLAAVVSVPEVLPSQAWLGELLGGGKLASIEEAQRVAGLVMKLNNFVAKSLIDQQAELVCPDLDDERACVEFVSAYLDICLQTDLNDDPGTDVAKLMGMLAGFAKAPASELKRTFGSAKEIARFKQTVRESLPDIIASLHGTWLGQRGGPATPVRREGPKVGRNDPCTCGSGKKYKKCCGANA